MLSKHKIAFSVINGGMVSMFISSAVDCEFQTRSGQIKDYKIGIKNTIEILLSMLA
jgi:hypothetical protein